MLIFSEATTGSVLLEKVVCPAKGAEACSFIKKETLAHAFSSQFCEISKNTFFTEYLWMTASVFWAIVHSTQKQISFEVIFIN